jgi:hypothetical protein
LTAILDGVSQYGNGPDDITHIKEGHSLQNAKPTTILVWNCPCVSFCQKREQIARLTGAVEPFSLRESLSIWPG